MGAIVSLETLWALAQAWYADRVRSDWRRRTVSEAQAVFRDVGLDGPFWDLAPR